MSVFADGLMRKAHTQMKDNFKQTGLYETYSQHLSSHWDITPIEKIEESFLSLLIPFLSLTYIIRYFYHVYFVMNLKFYRQAILIKALIFS